VWGWLLLLALVALVLWFLFTPRKLQTLHNEQAITTKGFRARVPVDTAEDPSDLSEIGHRTAEAASDRTIPERRNPPHQGE
jgi:Sec-independent protein translocase protein TatA